MSHKCDCDPKSFKSPEDMEPKELFETVLHLLVCGNCLSKKLRELQSIMERSRTETPPEFLENCKILDLEYNTKLQDLITYLKRCTKSIEDHLPEDVRKSMLNTEKMIQMAPYN